MVCCVIYIDEMGFGWCLILLYLGTKNDEGVILIDEVVLLERVGCC